LAAKARYAPIGERAGIGLAKKGVRAMVLVPLSAHDAGYTLCV
jgi:hypothetical protein